MTTHFADPARADAATVRRQVQDFFTNPFSDVLLKAAGGFLLVLNTHRQILAANTELLEALDAREGDGLVGMHPGEALHCLHADQGPAGCGTSTHCAYCGAVLAILAAQAGGEPAEGECRILMRRDGALEAAEFLVRVTPLKEDGAPFLAMVLLDISDRKRKEVFERLFFHDLVNTIQCLEGWGERLGGGTKDPAHAAEVLLSLVQRLANQVNHHKILLQAERGQLQLRFEPVAVRDLFDSLQQQFQLHGLVRERSLEIAAPSPETTLVTDRELLQRVLANMIMNALEATPPGGQVRVWHAEEGGRPIIHVSNPGVLAPEIAMQLFHRSFSTKGGYGRGLGTYGMKLLGEGQLGGALSFTSDELNGTCFTIALPSNPAPAAP